MRRMRLGIPILIDTLWCMYTIGYIGTCYAYRCCIICMMCVCVCVHQYTCMHVHAPMYYRCLCHAMLFHAMICHVTSQYFLICYLPICASCRLFMLCHVMSWPWRLFCLCVQYVLLLYFVVQLKSCLKSLYAVYVMHVRYVTYPMRVICMCMSRVYEMTL